MPHPLILLLPDSEDLLSLMEVCSISDTIILPVLPLLDWFLHSPFKFRELLRQHSLRVPSDLISTDIEDNTFSSWTVEIDCKFKKDPPIKILHANVMEHDSEIKYVIQDSSTLAYLAPAMKKTFEISKAIHFPTLNALRMYAVLFEIKNYNVICFIEST